MARAKQEKKPVKHRYYRLTDKQYQNMMAMFAQHGIPILDKEAAERHVAKKSEEARAALLERLGND